MVEGPVVSSRRASRVSGSRWPEAVGIRIFSRACGSSRYDIGQPDDQREPPFGLEDLADLDAARRRDGVEHLPGRDPVAGQGVAVDLDRGARAGR